MSSGLGQVGLIPGSNNLVQYLICKVTRSHVAHTITDIGNGECMSAEPGGARIRRLEDFPTAVWSSYNLAPAQAEASAAWARARQGTPYNWFDDAVIGIEETFGIRLPAWIENGAWNSTTLECAQLADQALAAGGFQAFDDGRHPNRVYPGSFEHDWIRRGWYTAEFFASFRIGIGSQVRPQPARR
jgi:hypothetical protein